MSLTKAIAMETSLCKTFELHAKTVTAEKGYINKDKIEMSGYVENKIADRSDSKGETLYCVRWYG